MATFSSSSNNLPQGAFSGHPQGSRMRKVGAFSVAHPQGSKMQEVGVFLEPLRRLPLRARQGASLAAQHSRQLLQEGVYSEPPLTVSKEMLGASWGHPQAHKAVAFLGPLQGRRMQEGFSRPLLPIRGLEASLGQTRVPRLAGVSLAAHSSRLLGEAFLAPRNEGVNSNRSLVGCYLLSSSSLQTLLGGCYNVGAFFHYIGNEGGRLLICFCRSIRQGLFRGCAGGLFAAGCTLCLDSGPSVSALKRLLCFLLFCRALCMLHWAGRLTPRQPVISVPQQCSPGAPIFKSRRRQGVVRGVVAARSAASKMRDFTQIFIVLRCW